MSFDQFISTSCYLVSMSYIFDELVFDFQHPHYRSSHWVAHLVKFSQTKICESNCTTLNFCLELSVIMVLKLASTIFLVHTIPWTVFYSYPYCLFRCFISRIIQTDLASNGVSCAVFALQHLSTLEPFCVPWSYWRDVLQVPTCHQTVQDGFHQRHC